MEISIVVWITLMTSQEELIKDLRATPTVLSM
jgi:hypothetical protein